MNKRNRIIYYVITGLFSAHMLFTVFAYFFMHEMVADMFESLGVPVAMIYPIAIAKILGLIAIWTNKSRLLKELAYLGFAIDFILAIGSHLMANDGGAIGPFIALVMASISYILHRKLFRNKNLAPL